MSAVGNPYQVTRRAQAGAEAPAGRTNAGARRTADHPARHVRAWRPWGVPVP